MRRNYKIALQLCLWISKSFAALISCVHRIHRMHSKMDINSGLDFLYVRASLSISNRITHPLLRGFRIETFMELLPKNIRCPVYSYNAKQSSSLLLNNSTVLL